MATITAHGATYASVKSATDHVTYLRYQNRRAEYTRAWWNVLDWTKIAARYAAAKAGTLKV